MDLSCFKLKPSCGEACLEPNRPEYPGRSQAGKIGTRSVNYILFIQQIYILQLLQHTHPIMENFLKNMINLLDRLQQSHDLSAPMTFFGP